MKNFPAGTLSNVPPTTWEVLNPFGFAIEAAEDCALERRVLISVVEFGLTLVLGYLRSSSK